MSNEHYIDPEKFDRLVKEEKLMKIGYSIDNDFDIKYAENVINSLRPINRKDPGFKYSCKCDKYETIWLFGYTDQTVYEEADKKVDEVILQNRELRGDTNTDVCGMEFGDFTACQCPFDV
jgi:hypothetical protein